MVDEIVDPRERIVRLIDTDQCRAVFEPHLVFVCGGQVDPTSTSNHSIRNMFMNLSAAIVPDNEQDFILAENFKDWKDGYKSLSDFENDIAHISSLVVVFLESEGSLTEFGLFFANESLRKKLVVVLDSQHYESGSFIKFGLLNPLEELDERLVRAYEIDHKNIESVSKEDVKDIVHDISNHCRSTTKTEKFRQSDRGHKIFMIFQVVDMFLALTLSEIEKYMGLIDVDLSRSELRSALFVLQKFDLLRSKKQSSQTFYFAAVGRSARVEIKFGQGERYDPKAIQIEVSEFYRTSIEKDRNFKSRVKVIESSAGLGDAK